MTPWLPYSPGKRTFPELPRDLEEQLQAVVPSHDAQLAYRPCKATLRDGTVIERVYVLDAQSYISQWGAWPTDDGGKHSVDIAQVIRLEESPHRLPADMADQLYKAGESGMGYMVFTVVFKDGTHEAYVSGNAVDFIAYPVGKSGKDVRSVIPHRGSDAPLVDHSPYHWCLYGIGISNRKSKRWAD